MEIFLNEDIKLETFEDLKIIIKFIAFLPQQLEIIKHTNYESSIILGNTCGPAIDLAAILIQNWTDAEMNLSKGIKILTIAFDNCESTVILGSAKSE